MITAFSSPRVRVFSRRTVFRTRDGRGELAIVTRKGIRRRRRARLLSASVSVGARERYRHAAARLPASPPSSWICGEVHDGANSPTQTFHRQTSPRPAGISRNRDARSPNICTMRISVAEIATIDAWAREYERRRTLVRDVILYDKPSNIKNTWSRSYRRRRIQSLCVATRPYRNGRTVLVPDEYVH